MSGTPLLKIVESDNLDRSPSALKRRRAEHRSCRRRGHHPSAASTFRAPARYRPVFQMSAYGRIWMSTEARTILGSDSGSVSSHRCAENFGVGTTWTAGGRLHV